MHAYPVHDSRPALVRHTLEDGEHRESEVVEVRDAVIRTRPVTPAHQSLVCRTLIAIRTTGMRIAHHFAWQSSLQSDRRSLDSKLGLTGQFVEASFMHFPRKQLQADDGVDHDDKDHEQSDV